MNETLIVIISFGTKEDDQLLLQLVFWHWMQEATEERESLVAEKGVPKTAKITIAV